MLARTRSLTLAVLSGSKIKVAPVSIAPVDETADNPGTEVAQAPEASDVELVARAVGGEEDAFEELLNRHRRRVARVALLPAARADRGGRAGELHQSLLRAAGVHQPPRGVLRLLDRAHRLQLLLRRAAPPEAQARKRAQRSHRG